MKASKINSQDTKWVFLKKGTCSRTLYYMLNREFDNPQENEERAADPLAGGIMQQGYQCGLLSGAVLAVGAESHRRCGDCGKAIGLAVSTTQKISDSFLKRAKSIDCLDITEADFSSKMSMAKYFMSGKFISCYKLADKWAPEAIMVAEKMLDSKQEVLSGNALSCASEVVRIMGGTEGEVVTVAGFAGGLGLSGNACGALSAAIWKSSLTWCESNHEKNGYPNPGATKTLEAFFAETDYEFLCHKISGRHFKTLEEHTEFIKNGGCEKLIGALAHAG